jgi:hypothetical protein
MTTEYINITPTWAAITPLLCRTLVAGSAHGCETATTELLRMADLADRYNHMIKRMGEAAAREYLATYGEAADLAGSDIEGGTA